MLKKIESADGTKIAYDIAGSGPALMLLHGAGKTRQDWHRIGYVDGLSDRFTVIAVDIRGSGDSDFLTEINDFNIEKVTGDLLLVADACEVQYFALWGYSFGGNIARYLGAWTDRVSAAAVIGVPFGTAVDEAFDRYIDQFMIKYGHLADAYRSGSQTEAQRKSNIKGRIPVWTTCFQAMREWPSISAREMRCPTMLLVGTKNNNVIRYVDDHRADLEEAGVQLEIIDGLNHQQEFSQITKVLPPVREFLAKYARNRHYRR